jgi:hypothetical protein
MKRKTSLRRASTGFFTLILTSMIFAFGATNLTNASSNLTGVIEPVFESKLPSLETAVFWVEFKDRPFYGSTLKDRLLYLNAHNDLPPVNENYVAQIEALGFRHRVISELTNEASFEGDPMGVYTVASLPFVKRISEVEEGTPGGIQVGPAFHAPPNPPGTALDIPTTDNHVCYADHDSMFAPSGREPFNNKVPMQAINISGLHNNGYNGSGIIIGIIDSGIHENNTGGSMHETFDVNVSGGNAKIFMQKDFPRNDNFANDEIGHGTAVAGICAGFTAGTNYYYVSTAPDARLAIAKMSYVTANNDTLWPADYMAKAVKWCVNTADVDIINLSVNWWGNSYPNTGYNRPARWLDWAAKQGVICCNSAANDFGGSPGWRSIYAPAGNFNCITVGATRPDGNAIAAYSRRGPAGDSRLKPDVAAPGGVNGSGSTRWNQDSLIACPHNGGQYSYAWYQGTSFASPITAGAIACMIESRNALQGQPLKTRMRLWETAVDKGTAGPDSIWGFGLLDIGAADNSNGYANFLIRDTRQGIDGGSKTDNGYLVSCDTGTEPDTGNASNGVGIYEGRSGGDDAFWKCPDIFVDNDNDGNPDDPNQPIEDSTNTFRVWVMNIGDAAGTANVRLYYSNPNTGMSDWTEIGSGQTSVSPDDSNLVSIDWDTPTINDLGQSHWCIGATVEDITGGRRDDQRPTPGNPAWGARPRWDVVKCDNFAIRNFWIRSNGSTDSLYFECGNTMGESVEITLYDVSTLPQNWALYYNDTTFTLSAGEIRECTLFVDIPDSAVVGSSADISIEAITDDGEVIGGFSQVVKKAAAHHFDDCQLVGWTTGMFGPGMIDGGSGMYISPPCGLLVSSPGTNSAAWGITPDIGLDPHHKYSITSHFVALTPDNYDFQVLNNDQVILELDYPAELVALQPTGGPIPVWSLNPGMWYTITVRCDPDAGVFDIYFGEIGAPQNKVASGEVMNPVANDYLLLGDIDSLGGGRGECAWDDIVISGTFVPVYDLALTCTPWNIYVPTVNGNIIWQMDVQNIGNMTVAEVWGRLTPFINGCLGTPFEPWASNRQLVTNLPPSATFTGRYFMRVSGISGISLGGVDLKVGPSVGDWKDECCFDVYFFDPWARQSAPPDWIVVGWGEYDGPYVENISLPKEYSLQQNYPNPFNAETKISFALPHDVHTRLTVYNIMGQVVEVLVDENLPAGYHHVTWNGAGFASGVYFYRLDAGDKSFTRRMTLLK